MSTMTRRVMAAVTAGVGVLTLGLPSVAEAGSTRPSAAPTSSASTLASAPPTARATTQPCAELSGLRLSSARIGLPTRGAQVLTATPVAASPTDVAHCRVSGAIDPADRSAPQIRFRVDLPDRWNQRTMLFGGGGANGTVPNIEGNLPAGPANTPTPLAQGFVTYASDSGHQAGPATSRDGRFALNDEALRNFAGDALKKTHDVAMALTRERYGVAPQFRYVVGGSTGGREALASVSRWPRDFDGALVLYPAWNAAALDLQFGRITRTLAAPGAYPSPAKRTALLNAALQMCDGLDGARDGIISDQSGCDAVFDPATARVGTAPLRCPGGADTGPACLSDRQIRAFETIDTPLRLSYGLADGSRGYPGFTTWGTDFGAIKAHPLQATVTDLTLGLIAPASPMPPVRASGSPPYGSTFWDEWVRYAITRNPGFDSLSLDPQQPGRWQRRIVELSALQDVRPDGFAAFARRGGKILIAHGVHDGLVSNRATRDFVARVRADLGPKTTRKLLRYYEIPGYGHAVSTTFNAEWNSLPSLQSWVERGTAPGAQVVTDRVGVPSGRSRPLCEFPAWPRYVSGSVNEATSFRCVEGSAARS